MSRRVLEMSPHRLSGGLAFEDDDHLITTTGETMPLSEMSSTTRAQVERFDKKIVSSFDPNAPFGSSSVSTSTATPKKPRTPKSASSGSKKPRKPKEPKQATTSGTSTTTSPSTKRQRTRKSD